MTIKTLHAVESPTVADAAGARQRTIRLETRLFQSPVTRYGAAALALAAIVVPLLTNDPFVLALGITVGIFSIGAVGLNVLNGYAGQISLAQPFFLAVGAFTAVGVGGVLQLPLPVWILASALAGGLAGFVVAPFALRLRGVYQIVLSLGLIYIGYYIFVNWKSLTGGNVGTRASLNMQLGPIDLGALSLGNMLYNYQQGLFMVVWVLVAASMFLVHRIMKSATGRAMVALRDSDLAARVAGVNSFRTLSGAFIISSALGGIAGAMYVTQLRYVSIEQFNLAMALQFVIIVTVGGLGTAWGPVVGSLVICSIPLLAGRVAGVLPFLKTDSAAPNSGLGIPAGQFSILVYGLLLILVLLFEPRGLVNIFGRLGRKIARLLSTLSRRATDTRGKVNTNE